MSDTTAIPSGTVTLTLGEPSWDMDLVGTIRAVQAERKRLAKEAAAREEEQPDAFAHLDLLKTLVKAASGPDLNDTQAEWLEDQLALLWAKKKSERNAAMLEVQQSANFTE